ncbi:hypothetical protein IIA16_03070 [bacterium]|nr:hypothetical protein [bacterium]
MLSKQDIGELLEVQDKTRDIEGLRTELHGLAQELRLAQARKALRGEETALKRREEALARLRKELLLLENRVHTLTHEIEGLEKKASGEYAGSHRTVQEIMEKTGELREEKTLREKELADRTIQSENLERSILEQRERLVAWNEFVEENEARYKAAEVEMEENVVGLEKEIDSLTVGLDEAVAADFLDMARRSHGIAIAHVLTVAGATAKAPKRHFCSACRAELAGVVAESLARGITRCSHCARYLVP